MSSKLKNKLLVIRDEIHGDMVFDNLLRCTIDHPCFQRLRYIKQLGLAEYVFPCATHTRFQHSLGACYLAGQYFDSMVSRWLTAPFRFEGHAEGTTFFAERTLNCIREVTAHAASQEYWRQVVSLGGLLHDVGHGPWSHTFEHLNLNQDYEATTDLLTGSVGKYFANLRKNKEPLHHEDLSVLYIFQILKDLGDQGVISNYEQYFLPVAMLVNKKMASGESQELLEAELGTIIEAFQIRGGLDFHRLLRPVISGPFDVDRMDYIQRDGRNCGVSISGIEWRRIVAKLVPCLADHLPNRNEPREVVLVSNIKNQHVLDDFIFTLFQMYAQIYLHPKIVGLEEVIKRLLSDRVDPRKLNAIDFKTHRSLSDERFQALLRQEFNITEIDRILAREIEASFEVARFPADSGMEGELTKHGFRQIAHLDRPMMKDSVGLFLFSSFKGADPDTYFLRTWSAVSPIAQQFYTINYSPHIWVRTHESLARKN